MLHKMISINKINLRAYTHSMKSPIFDFIEIRFVFKSRYFLEVLNLKKNKVNILFDDINKYLVNASQSINQTIILFTSGGLKFNMY